MIYPRSKVRHYSQPHDSPQLLFLPACGEMKSQMIFSPSGTSLFQHPNPVKIPYAAHSGHSALHPIIEKTGHCQDPEAIGVSIRLGHPQPGRHSQ